jgi:hypothetical protein
MSNLESSSATQQLKDRMANYGRRKSTFSPNRCVAWAKAIIPGGSEAKTTMTNGNIEQVAGITHEDRK